MVKIQTKKVKLLLELYQFGKDKKEYQLRLIFLILKAKRCETTVVSFHFECFVKVF